MCKDCTTDVAEAGTMLDELIQSEIEAHEHFSGTDINLSIRLACIIRDVYLENQGHKQLQDMCLGFSIAIQRLVALQQINGSAL